MLSVTRAAGFPTPADTGLRLTAPLPDVTALAGEPEYIVVHSGSSVPARAPLPGHCADYVRAIARDGWRVVVTGSPAERELTREAAGQAGTDLGGRTDLARLAADTVRWQPP